MEQLFGDDSGKMIVTCSPLGISTAFRLKPTCSLMCAACPIRSMSRNSGSIPGLEQAVQEYVLAGETSQGLVQRLDSLLDYLLPLYLAEGKCSLVIGFGCTGGRHRSVTFAELFRERLVRKGYRVSVSHRDVNRSR